VSGERKLAEGADKKRDKAEDGDLDEDLTAGGGSKECEPANAGGVEVTSDAAEAIVMAALNPKECDDHEEREVAARERSR